MAMETLKLKPSDTYATMTLLLQAGLPGFIWGPPGIGKSEISKQLANEMGIAFVDIRLSQMDPTDVRGMPYKVEEGGVTTGVAWSPPLSFPRDLDETLVRDIQPMATNIKFDKLNLRGTNDIPYVKNPEITVQSLTEGLVAELVTPEDIEERKAKDPYYGSDSFIVRLVDAADAGNPDATPRAGKVAYTITGEAEALMAFEELNSAPPSVLAACYQIILDRRCGEYIVPKGVHMFAMGNRESDRGVTFRMPTPLANRFDHVEMKHDHEDWLDWAVQARVNSKVVGYIGASPGALMTTKLDGDSASRGFATPRSWTYVSRLLNTIDKGTPASQMQLLAAVTGAVGDSIGGQFLEFMKIAEDLPKPQDVLSGKVKKLETDNDNRVALSYHLTTQLLYILTEEHSELVAEGNTGRGGDKDYKNERRREWAVKMNNWLKFSMDNFKPEVCVMGVSQCMKNYNLPFNRDIVTNFEPFVDKYEMLLVSQH